MHTCVCHLKVIYLPVNVLSTEAEAEAFEKEVNSRGKPCLQI